MQVCIISCQRGSKASLHKDLFVGRPLPLNKVGLSRSVSRLAYAAFGLYGEGREEGGV